MAITIAFADSEKNLNKITHFTFKIDISSFDDPNTNFHIEELCLTKNIKIIISFQIKQKTLNNQIIIFIFKTNLCG